MSSLVQSGSVRYYMGWYGNCANDPQSPTGGCEPFDLVSEPRIRLVWEISDGIKAFSSASPSFSPIQQLEAGKCYMIAVNPGDGVIELPHLVLSGEGGYVGQSCSLALNFVTVNAYTRPNTSEIDYGYGYYPVQYAPGDTVTLTAKTRENYEFKEWSFFSPSSIWADITDATSSTITFTMPSEPVTVSAEYMDLTLDSDGDGIPDHLDPYPNQSPQAINWADTDLTLLVVGDTAELKATAQTDITYTISDASVGSISGNTLTILADGSAVITATAPANSQYFGATATISFQTDADSDGDGIPDSQDTEPYQQAQSITWNDDLSALSVGDVITLTASAQTSVTYTSSDESILSVSGNTATAASSGVATLTATAASTSDYFTATSTISASISEVSSDSEDAHLYWDGTFLFIEFTAVDENQNYQLRGTVDNAYSPPDPSGIGALSGVELYPEHTLWENDNSTGAAYSWARNALDSGYERWSVTINTADIYSDWTVLLPRLVHPVRGEVDFQLGGLFSGPQPSLTNGYAIEDTNEYSLSPFPLWKPQAGAPITFTFDRTNSPYPATYDSSIDGLADVELTKLGLVATQFAAGDEVTLVIRPSKILNVGYYGTDKPKITISRVDTGEALITRATPTLVEGVVDQPSLNDKWEYTFSTDGWSGELNIGIYLEYALTAQLNSDNKVEVSFTYADTYYYSSVSQYTHKVDVEYIGAPAGGSTTYLFDTTKMGWRAPSATSEPVGEYITFILEDHVDFPTQAELDSPIQPYTGAHDDIIVRIQNSSGYADSLKASIISNYYNWDTFTKSKQVKLRSYFAGWEYSGGGAIGGDWVTVDLPDRNADGVWDNFGPELVQLVFNGALGPNFLGADLNFNGGESMAESWHAAGETVLVNVTPPDGQVTTSVYWVNSGATVNLTPVSTGVYSLTVPTGQNSITINASFEVASSAPTFDGWNLVVDSPAQVEMPSDGSVPTVDVNGDPLFIAHPDENDPDRVHFSYLDGTLGKELILNNRSDFEVRFAKFGTVNMIYTDSSGNVFDTPLDLMGTYHADLDDNVTDVAIPTSSTSVGRVIVNFNSNVDVAALHGLYGDFAIYVKHSSGYIYMPTSYGPSKSTIVVKQSGLTFQEEATTHGGISATRFGPLSPGEYQLGYIPDNDSNGDPYQFNSLTFGVWSEASFVPDPVTWLVSEADTSGATLFGPGATVFGSGDTKLIFEGDVSATLL